MDQRSLTLLAVLFWVVLALSLVCILWMFFSLARQGDERRKAILTRACCHTFYTVVVLLVLIIPILVYQVRSFKAQEANR